MAENTRVVGVLVAPSENDEWVDELSRQAAASDLPIRIAPDSAPEDVD